MSQTLKSTIHKWDLMKWKMFCKAKETVNRAKGKPRYRERFFPNPTFNNGLIFKMYKEHKELDTRDKKEPHLKIVYNRAKQRILNKGISNSQATIQKMFSILNHSENINQNTLRFHLTGN